jgi:SAM-dependent methyltransferase
MFFLRKTTLSTEPMAVRMSGVRMGERLLQIGVDDAKLAGLMAAKVGLSGSAAMVVRAGPDERRARAAAAASGALIDTRIAPLDALPFEKEAFDVVVVNSMRGLLAMQDIQGRAQILRETHRVLRPGGRVLLLEPGPREGFAALLRPFREAAAYRDAGGGVGALESAGFRPVRQLAQREGYRFTEGLKT